MSDTKPRKKYITKKIRYAAPSEQAQVFTISHFEADNDYTTIHPDPDNVLDYNGYHLTPDQIDRFKDIDKAKLLGVTLEEYLRAKKHKKISKKA